ncbi:hypothetical protein [Candidatus Magnetominusculus xianensis]|uniref:Phage-Barnase-EndoU-ColicinE5/D-RelE like nuclease 3 domain-containing protein n=1 Tax=Candidatus Magnetominusculus xianensis TaxID=1748249 RepID=A0ABR5SBU4_9BACT|nr:hypothetical protein [Candidatus Magnetominusculus xianensis]KWT73768.1 hypothetical protein ASN18_3350 [Candidatus Magnetominusculus xianensis]MBF0404789.1 hypothetical protein [Nitrospirota bacterium]
MGWNNDNETLSQITGSTNTDESPDEVNARINELLTPEVPAPAPQTQTPPAPMASTNPSDIKWNTDKETLDQLNKQNNVTTTTPYTGSTDNIKWNTDPETLAQLNGQAASLKPRTFGDMVQDMYKGAAAELYRAVGAVGKAAGSQYVQDLGENTAAYLDKNFVNRKSTMTEDYHDLVKDYYGSYADIPTQFVKGVTLGYGPDAVATPDNAGIMHKAAAGAAGLIGMSLPLAFGGEIIGAAKVIPAAWSASSKLLVRLGASTLRGGMLGGAYGAVKNTEHGQGDISRITNALKDAALFAGFGVGGELIGSLAARISPIAKSAMEKLLVQEKLADSNPDLFLRIKAGDAAGDAGRYINPKDIGDLETFKLSQLTAQEQAAISLVGAGRAATLGAGAGAAEPAKDWKERARNMTVGMFTFFLQHFAAPSAYKGLVPGMGRERVSVSTQQEKAAPTEGTANEGIAVKEIVGHTNELPAGGAMEMPSSIQDMLRAKLSDEAANKNRPDDFTLALQDATMGGTPRRPAQNAEYTPFEEELNKRIKDGAPKQGSANMPITTAVEPARKGEIPASDYFQNPEITTENMQLANKKADIVDTFGGFTQGADRLLLDHGFSQASIDILNTKEKANITERLQKQDVEEAASPDNKGSQAIETRDHSQVSAEEKAAYAQELRNKYGQHDDATMNTYKNWLMDDGWKFHDVQNMTPDDILWNISHKIKGREIKTEPQSSSAPDTTGAPVSEGQRPDMQKQLEALGVKPQSNDWEASAYPEKVKYITKLIESGGGGMPMSYEAAMEKLFKQTKEKPGALQRVALRKVSPKNVEEIRRTAKEKGVDIDVTGYTHTIDNSFINHALGEHDNIASEKSRGLEAITEKDIYRIPEITSTPDKVEYLPETKKSKATVLYIKRINGEVYYYEEIRHGRKELAAATLFKKRTALGEQMPQDETFLTQPNLLRGSSLDSNIPQPTEPVKLENEQAQSNAGEVAGKAEVRSEGEPVKDLKTPNGESTEFALGSRKDAKREHSPAEIEQARQGVISEIKRILGDNTKAEGFKGNRPPGLDEQLVKLGVKAHGMNVDLSKVDVKGMYKHYYGDDGRLHHVIKFAMTDPVDMKATGYHEVGHGIYRTLEAINRESDIDILENAYKESAAKNNTNVREEIAHAFRDYAIGKEKPRGFVQRIFDRIMNFINKLKGYFVKNDIRTPEDIFGEAYSGKLQKDYEGHMAEEDRLFAEYDKFMEQKGKRDSSDTPEFSLKETRGIEIEDKEVEARLTEARGIKTLSLPYRIKQTLTQAGQEFTRHFPLLSSKKDGAVIDILRQYENVPSYARTKAVDEMKVFVQGLGKEDYAVFERKLIFDDLKKDIGDAETPGILWDKELPFGLKSKEQVSDYLDNKIDPYIESHPALKSALQKRNERMIDIKQQLVDNKLLSEGVMKDDRYFHHQVLEYMALRAMGEAVYTGTSGESVGLRKKGWQLARKGSAKDFNTNYLESEYEVLAQSISQIETAKTLKILQSEADISAKLKEEAKAQGIKDWKELLPDDYTLWQPEKGNHFYRAQTITDKVLEDIAIGGEIDRGDMRTAFAMGRLKEQWAIPKRLARTLDNFRDFKDEGMLSNASANIQITWKQWILMNPYRLLKYNMNNMSGDIDIVLAYNPAIMKYTKQATTDLWHQYKNRELSPELKAELDNAMKKGVIGSGISISEIPDISKEGIFKMLTGESENAAVRWVGKAWQTSKDLTTLRENIMRLASYRYFKDIVKDRSDVYGASKKSEIDAIKNPDDRAAKLARELIGDYGNVSHAGQWIRRHMIPFYSWLEVNAPRYVNLMRNLKHEGRDAGSLGGVMAWKVGKLALKASMLYGAISIWNATMFPDEEKEIGEGGRKQLHVILGRRSDGSILSLRLQGALSDALSWFNLEDLPNDVKDVVSGKVPLSKKLTEMYKGPVEKVFQGMRPVEKSMIVEPLMGRSFYPDMWSPRPIRDKLQHILKTWSLDNIYDWATGKPKRGGDVTGKLVNDLAGLLTYTTDAGESAYYDTIKMTRDYLEKLGEEKPTALPTSRGTALYYYKQSLKYGDIEAARKYLDKYKNLGGKMSDVKASIKRADPLAMLPAKYRDKFMAGLDAEDRAKIERAKRWYRETYLGKEKMQLQPNIPADRQAAVLEQMKKLGVGK